ncbi:glycosyltransferase family 2 protein [Arsenicibacter rosenii]|uniref:Glycosyl transferase family 2 n=1 Tax=Arsenicibacter rosenii TaxID=1750698 RepID=A0A1S2VLD3_9BACT|nr:glycosyltransferase family A protein [Arsenicibacter rosenii]OIN59587.1 glycosyl transferase family 2 [Arsenicibacter rosenii]
MAPYLHQHKPWVTVICTAYNHESFVSDALQSVVQQQYPKVELIVVDNASTDQTAARIQAFVNQHPDTHFIRNTTNTGLCKAFNQALRIATGKYVIDLSADDVMLPDRIARQVARLEELDERHAVVFSNAQYIDESGQLHQTHYPVDELGQSTMPIPTGDIFRHVLSSYFICTPTMMIRKSALDELNGYDESLSYEDFDFWVRSARNYKYAYIDAVLTRKRRLSTAQSLRIIRTDNQLLSSTLAVCYKAYMLCQSADEFKALASRIRTFVRKSFYTEQYDLAHQFGNLLSVIEQPDPLTRAILLASHLHLPVNGLYRQYLRWWGADRSIRMAAGSA